MFVRIAIYDKVVSELTIVAYSLFRGPLRSCGTHQCNACCHVVKGDLSVCGDCDCGPARPGAHEGTADGLQSAHRRGETVIASAFEHTRSRLCVCDGIQEEHSGVGRQLRGRPRVRNI